jgi:squalene-associated FAD-dependent desaturase
MIADRVAVIGGGYAGFAAAVTLATAGCSVTVFESARTLGGRARRVEAYRNTIDNGQHILLGAYAQTLALIRTVHGAGAEPELLDRRRLCLEEAGVFRLSTPALPAPLHLAVALLLARGWSWADRQATIAFVRGLRREHFRCDSALTVGSLLGGQPAAVIRALWEPLCLAALNTPITVASATVFLNVLAAAFGARARDSDLLLPRVDLSSLFPDPAAAYVADRGGEIRKSTMVNGLGARADGIMLRIGYREERFYAAVLAVGPHQLTHLRFDGEGDPRSTQALNEVAAFAYEPIVTAYLQYSTPLELAHPMQKLDGAPGQWVFDRGQLDGPKGLAAVVISTDLPSTRIGHNALARSIDAQLHRLQPSLPAPTWMQVIAERRATYACIAGLARPAPGKIAPRLWLAGDYTDPELPATLEAATRSGVTAARALLQASA